LPLRNVRLRSINNDGEHLAVKGMAMARGEGSSYGLVTRNLKKYDKRGPKRIYTKPSHKLTHDVES
jgi:hypothetical protein